MRRNLDVRLRELERRAAQGDEEALEELVRHKVRSQAFPILDPVEAMVAVRQFLQDTHHAYGTWLYTRDQWRERGEEYGNDAPFSAAADGAGSLNGLYNYPSREDLVDLRAFNDFLEAIGWELEQGYSWSFHFYPLDEPARRTDYNARRGGRRMNPSELPLFGGREDRWRHQVLFQALPKKFHPEDYELERDLDPQEAQAFVAQHHYLGGIPNSTRFLYGMRYRPTWELVGVAAFGSPAFGTVLPSSFPKLKDRSQLASELTRLVLDQEVPKNGESWFVSQAFKDLEKRKDQRGVVSFSDPRYGHVGGVYQALEGWHTGMSKPGKIHVLPDGTELHQRQWDKIRAADKVWAGCHGSGKSISGWKKAIEFAVSHGAPRPAKGACLWQWLDAVTKTRPAAFGKFRYVWGLDPEQKRRMKERLGAVDYSVYPKLCQACREIVPREFYDRATSLCLDCLQRARKPKGKRRRRNPDDRLRRLERRWKQGGSVEDEAAFLRERLRVGQLDPKRLELAAALGYPAAMEVLPAFKKEDLPGRLGLSQSWVRNMLGTGRGGTDEYAVRCMIALSESVLPILMTMYRWDAGEGPRCILELARNWLETWSNAEARETDRVIVQMTAEDLISLEEHLRQTVEGYNSPEELAGEVFADLVELISTQSELFHRTRFFPMGSVERGYRHARRAWERYFGGEAEVIAWLEDPNRERDARQMAHDVALDVVRREVVPWLLA